MAELLLGKPIFPGLPFSLPSLFHYLLIFVQQYMPETKFFKAVYLAHGRAAAGQAYLPRFGLFFPSLFHYFLIVVQ